MPAQWDATAHAFTRLPRQGGQMSRFSLSNSSFARFFWQRSNFTQRHSIPLDSLNKVAKRLDFSLDILLDKNMHSSVSLAGKYKWWYIFLADKRCGNMSSWKVERKVERKIESFGHTCSTTLNYRSTLRSNVEEKMKWTIESFGQGLTLVQLFQLTLRLFTTA